MRLVDCIVSVVLSTRRTASARVLIVEHSDWRVKPPVTHHNGRFAQCHNLVLYLPVVLFIAAIKAQEAAGVLLLKTKMQTERPTNKQQL